jgi:hypothetical protein
MWAPSLKSILRRPFLEGAESHLHPGLPLELACLIVRLRLRRTPQARSLQNRQVASLLSRHLSAGHQRQIPVRLEL